MKILCLHYLLDEIHDYLLFWKLLSKSWCLYSYVSSTPTFTEALFTQRLHSLLYDFFIYIEKRNRVITPLRVILDSKQAFRN